MPDQSYDVAATAARIKAQYPEYGHLDDADLVGRLAQKQPSVLQQFAVMPQAPAQPPKPPAPGGRVQFSPEDTAKFKKAASGERAIPPASAFVENIPNIVTTAVTVPTGGLGLIPRLGIAAASGAGAEGLRQLGAKVTGHGNDPDEPQTAEERTKSMINAGLINTAGEVIGSGIGSALTGPARPKPGIPGQTATTAGPYPATAPITDVEVRDMSNREGLGLTTGEINPKAYGNRILQWLGDRSPLGAMIANARQASAIKRAGALTDSQGAALLNSVPMGPQLTGQIAHDSAQMNRDIFSRVGGGYYKDIDRLANGVMVDMRPFKAELKRQYDEVYAPLEMANPRFKEVESPVKQVLGFLDGPNELPFYAAHKVFSQLGKINRNTQDLIAPGQAAMILGASRDAIEKQMEQAAISTGNPQVIQKWQQARDFWRRGMDTFERSNVNRFANNPTAPERAFSTLIEPRAPSSVDHAKRAIFDYAEQYGTAQEKQQAQRAWDAFREHWTRENVIGDPGRQGLDLDTLRSINKRIEKWGPEVIDKLYHDADGKVVIRNLKTISEAMNRLTTPPKAASSGFYAMSNAAAGAVGLASHMISPEALGAYVAVPGFISWMVHSPAYTKKFTEGFLKATTPEQAKTVATSLLRQFYDSDWAKSRDLSPQPENQLGLKPTNPAGPDIKVVGQPPFNPDTKGVTVVNKYRKMSEPPTPPANKYRQAAGQ